MAIIDGQTFIGNSAEELVGKLCDAGETFQNIDKAIAHGLELYESNPTEGMVTVWDSFPETAGVLIIDGQTFIGNSAEELVGKLCDAGCTVYIDESSPLDRKNVQRLTSYLQDELQKYMEKDCNSTQTIYSLQEVVQRYYLPPLEDAKSKKWKPWHDEPWRKKQKRHRSK